MKIHLHIKQYFKYIFIISVASFLKSALSFVNPMIIKKILDLISIKASIQNMHVNKYFILFFSTILIIYSIDFFLAHLKLAFSFIFKVKEQEQAYNELLSIRFDSFYKNGPTYYVHRIYQFIHELFMLLSSHLSSILIASFTIIISLSFLYKANGILFMVALLLLPLNYFGYKHVNKKLLEKSKKLQEAAATSMNNNSAIVSNLETIKQTSSFNSVLNLLKNNFIHMENAHNEINLYAQRASLSLSFSIDFIKNFIFAFLVYLLYLGKITFSELIFLNMIFNVYTSGLSELNKININLRDLKVGIQFITDEIFAKKEKDTGKLTVNKIEKISLDIKDFAYDDKIVLKNVSLLLTPGKKYAIAGSSGCGKSTIARLLIRLYMDGGISINDIPIADYSLKSLRSKVFLLSHTPQLFPTSIKENIFIVSDNTDEKVYEKILELSFLKNLREKYDFSATNVSSGNINLSSGEKQAICLARIFVKNPDVLIFDEATSAMDSHLENIFIEELDKKFDIKNKILIFISHRLSTIKKCDEIILMKDGVISKIFKSYEDAIKDKDFIELYKSQIS